MRCNANEAMTANFTFLPGAVASADCPTRDDVLVQLADLLARAYGLDRVEVLDALEEREKLGSTGFGRGIALPHARIDGIRRPVAALLRLKEPVDFEAADGLPVDMAIGLVSPTQAGATHLHALAEISRMLRDETTREALLDAQDEEAMYALITNAGTRDAA